MKWKIPLFKVYMSPKEVLLPALEEVLYSGFIAEGERVKEFEGKLQEYFGISSIYTTNSGTSSLTVAMYAAGVRSGTSVISTPQTCIATATPITTLGADIIWGDVDPIDGMLNPESVESRIQEDTKAVVVVHWGGDVADIRGLQEVCKRNNVALIEDAAEALGAEDEDGKLVGVSGSDFICFSCQAIKHLTTGDGGFTVCNSEEKRSVGKKLTWFGIDRDLFRLPTGEINYAADVPVAGFKSHMNNIVGTIGCVQFDHVFTEVIPKHQHNGDKLSKMLQSVDGITVPPRRGKSAYWVCNILCDSRDELMQYLIGHGIQASRMHARIDIYSGLIVRENLPLPGLDSFSDRQLCLPCGWWVSDEDMEFMTDKIKAFFNKCPPNSKII